MRIITRFFLMFTALLMAVASQAQVTTGTISGTVKTGTGSDLEGASITATHTPSGTVYKTVSKKGGAFNMPGLRIGGPYVISVQYVGLKTETVQDVNLSLGDPYTVSIVLSDASQNLTEVVVSAQRSRKVADKTGTSTVVGQKQITMLPSISRSIGDFTRLTPQAGSSTNSSSQNSLGGRDGRFNNVTVDGANLNNNFGLSTEPLPGGGANPISLDAIDQISINIAPYDVRQSNFTGGNIAAVTKSGSNTFRGSAYTFYKDQSYVGTKIEKSELPPLSATQTNVYGGTLGGPIIKNKLFFFANYEYEKKTNPPATAFTPSGGSGSGNISNVKADSLKRFSDHLRNAYGYETGVYDNFPNFASKNTKILVRLDWNISQVHKLTAKYSDLSSTNDVAMSSSIANGAATGGPNTWTSQPRLSTNNMSYANSQYSFKDIVQSASIELNSNVSGRFSNQLIASYTKIQATRATPSAVFPFIDIIGDATKSGAAATYAGGARFNYMSAGYETFSYNNDVKNNILNITDNFTYYAGKHALTGGLSYEYQTVGNMFMPGSQSYYAYGSLQEFMTPGARPITYSLTFSRIPGKDAVYSAEMKIGQASFYAQDEWNVNSRLKVTYGIRADKPVYPEQPLENPSITALTFPDRNGVPTHYSTGQWPKSTLYFSPRVGARWDIKGDKSEILRGGTGIFTGKLPFVYLTNMPTNSGMYQVSVIANAAQLAQISFNPDPKAWQGIFTTPAPTPNSAGFVLIDPNYKYPQIWRTNLGYDRNLGRGWFLNTDFLLSKDINAIVMRNANEIAPTSTVTLGGSTRPSFTTNTTPVRRLYNAYANAIVLENALHGGTTVSFTAQVRKTFTNGLDMSLAYTFTDASDLTANPGSTASSTWSGNPTSNTQNTQEFAPSAFATPHRIVGTVTYRKEFLKHLASTIGFFYEGGIQGRFSYIYSSDVNWDGNSSDLMYIPRTASELTFTNQTIGSGSTAVTYTAADQTAAFDRYIAQDKYLSANKGKVAERNGAQTPFYHKVDFKFAQEIFTNIGSRRNTVVLSFDCFNFLNLLNKNWGVRDFFVSASPLLATKNATTGVVTYQLRTYIPAGTTTPILMDKTFIPSLSTTSTYSFQLGLRYIF
jgi:hypothetical protein